MSQSTRFRAGGEIAAKLMGGDRYSHRIEAHAATILQAYEARPQIYLREVKDALEENGVTASLSGLSRFLRRHGITRKRGSARRRARPPGRDGSARGVVRGATRPGACRVPRRDRDGYQHGAAPRGERCCIAVPHGHYKTTTVTAALRASGSLAVYLMDGATNGARFLSYVTDVLVPALTPDNTVVMDNLATHKVAGVRQAIEAVGAHLRYLPAYSPDFQPDRANVRQAKGPAAHGGGPHRPGPVGGDPERSNPTSAATTSRPPATMHTTQPERQQL